MKWLTLALCACTFSREKREDTSLRESEHARVVAEQRETETRTEGPEVVTTTVEEYEVSTPGAHPDSPPDTVGAKIHRSPEKKHGVDDLGPTILVKRTVTVDQRGPIIDTKATKATETASEDAGLDLTRHTDLRSKSAPALAGFLWIALLVGAIGLGVWLAWRFSLPGRVVALFK